MGTFDEAMAAAAPAFEAAFGTTGWQYAPVGGEPRAVIPIITTLPPERHGREVEARATLVATCRISDVNGFPASPNYGGDKLIAPDGKTYLVRQNPDPTPETSGMLTIALR